MKCKLVLEKVFMAIESQRGTKVRKRKNDVKRGGWSAHRLADESSYAIDTNQKLRQGDVEDEHERATGAETIAPPEAPHPAASKRRVRKKSNKAYSVTKVRG